MNCKNKNKKSCGCGGQPIRIQDTEGCNSEPCSELFSTECIMHTNACINVDIDGKTFSINKGERISNVLQKLLVFLSGDSDSSEIPLFKITDITDGTITVQIDSDLEKLYKVSYKTTDTWEDCNISQGVDVYTISNLSPNTEYLIKLTNLTDEVESVIYKIKTL